MTKRAAVLNDISGMGKCSLTAQIAVLSALGVQPCPVPTAVLSGQTEFSRYFSIDLSGAPSGFMSAWLENGETFDGICTGYFSNEKQLDAALAFIKSFPSLSIVDPVMGDDGMLYPDYEKKCCEKMKALAHAADIITPNLTELCILTDSSYEHLMNADFEEIAKLARCFKKAVVTGIHRNGMIYNLVVDGESTSTVQVKKTGERFSGTGDIFTAVVLGCLLRGKNLSEAAKIAAEFILKSVSDTVKEPHNPLYGINFEQNLNYLTEVSRNATE